MRPEITLAMAPDEISWHSAARELDASRKALSATPAGLVRQRAYSRWVDSRNRCTNLIHAWWAETLDLQPVRSPRMVFSLDVDGVLEDESAGFSCTGARGAAALRLLQLGQVAVLLNTARSLPEVQARVSTFKLLGGVSGFGAVVWDAVFSREESLLNATGASQLTKLRGRLRTDPEIVEDRTYEHSLRVACVVDGELKPVSGEFARRLLDRHGLSHLSFWVAPGHTDFVDRSADKGRGLQRLLEHLRLGPLPIAAMGDASCDVPMLRLAGHAFVPAATLPSYIAPRRQRLLRCRSLGEDALWDVACQLVPDTTLQRQVITAISELKFPEWFPPTVTQSLRQAGSVFPRLATALVARLTSKELDR